MRKLSTLLTVKDNNYSKDVEEIKEILIPTPEETDASILLSWYQKGYGDSQNANGNHSIFRTCLEEKYQEFKQHCRNDEVKQKKLNAPFIEERKRKETEESKYRIAQELNEERCKHYSKQIDELDFEIVDVQRNPLKFGIDADKRPRVKFWIGLILLILVSIYLFVFYVSASYSAFFKNFDSDKVIAAILDGNALSKAYDDGWLELIFVGTIPFAFMGLGYLIHMFQEQDRLLREKKGERSFGGVKIFALLVVTFTFDMILAYLIESKIYDYNKTMMDPLFDLKIAFTHIQFWGIIFAGFVVYLIWGLVFDFVMKEFDNIDKVKSFIRTKVIDKKNMKDKILELNHGMDEIKKKLTELIGQINEIQSKIDGFIFPNREYKNVMSQYQKGWEMAISKTISLPHKEKDELIKQCQLVSIEHLKEHNIINEDNENIIFTNSQ